MCGLQQRYCGGGRPSRGTPVAWDARSLRSRRPIAPSGPSHRFLRPRFAGTCLRRAPPPALVRGWTSHPGGSSSLRSTAAEASTQITLVTTRAIAASTRRMHRMPFFRQLLDLHHRSGRILPAVVRTMPVNRFPYLSRVLVITVLTYGEAALCSLKDNLSTLCFRPSLFERADLQRDMVNFGRCLTKG